MFQLVEMQIIIFKKKIRIIFENFYENFHQKILNKK